MRLCRVGRHPHARPDCPIRVAGRCRGRGDAGKILEHLENPRGRDAGRVVDARAQQRARRIAQLWASGPEVAVDHGRRHHEERDRHGDLEHDQRAAPPLAHAVRPGHGAQRVDLQPPRLVQRRRQAGGHAGQQRDDGRLDEHAGVDRQIEELDVAAALHDPPAQRERDAHAEDAAEGGDQDGLGEQRADDPAAARANRRANRDLVLARRPLRDHQDRDVRARDEERQHDRGGKDVGQDERHLMADRRAFDAEHAHAEVALGSGQTRRVVGQTRPQPGLEHGRRFARGPSHDHAEPLVGRQRLRVEPRPDRRVHVGEPEALGQDAGDRVRLVVDPDDLPDGVGAPVEEPLPDPVAEDRARGAVGAGFARRAPFLRGGP